MWGTMNRKTSDLFPEKVGIYLFWCDFFNFIFPLWLDLGYDRPCREIGKKKKDTGEEEPPLWPQMSICFSHICLLLSLLRVTVSVTPLHGCVQNLFTYFLGLPLEFGVTLLKFLLGFQFEMVPSGPSCSLIQLLTKTMILHPGYARITSYDPVADELTIAYPNLFHLSK